MLNKAAFLRRLHSRFTQSAIGYATTIKMPSLSPTMTAGTIVKWMKKEGDSVSPGDVVCEIQTDKAVVSLDADEEGTLAKILYPDNSQDVNVGTAIAVMADAGEDWKSVEVPKDSAAPSKPTKSKQPSAETSKAPAPKSESPRKQETAQATRLIGPATRLLIQSYGLSTEELHASGPRGSLMKSDVLTYVKSKNLSKPDHHSAKEQASKVGSTTVGTGAAYDDIQLTNMRKTIAKRLTQSKMSVPHEYLRIGINVNNVMKLRKQFKDAGDALTMNDFLIKAVALSLRAVPAVNVQYVNDSVKQVREIDISVAVATSSGLITPIVTKADSRGLKDIATTVRELAERAKENKLKLNEFQGGSFTISNLGMMGITHFTAIINAPQAAILAVGGAHPQCNAIHSSGVPLESTVVNKMSKASFENIMQITLCYDARAISANTAAQFVNAVQAYMEQPETLLTDTHQPSSTISDQQLAALL